MRLGLARREYDSGLSRRLLLRQECYSRAGPEGQPAAGFEGLGNAADKLDTMRRYAPSRSLSGGSDQPQCRYSLAQSNHT